MQVKFFINGFPALPENYFYNIPCDILQSLPTIGDIIIPFLQNSSYHVIDIKRVQKDFHLSTSFKIEYYYRIDLKPENESAQIAFEKQFGKKRKPK